MRKFLFAFLFVCGLIGGVHAATFTMTTIANTSSFNFSINATGYFKIEWGDGAVEIFENDGTTGITCSHTYKTAGIYNIGISGRGTGYFSNKTLSITSKSNLAGISGSLGQIFSTTTDGQQPGFNETFYNCTNLTGAIPHNLFYGIYGSGTDSKFLNFYSLFEECNMNGSIPHDLLVEIKGNPANIGWAFAKNKNLTGSIPPDLFAGLSGQILSTNIFKSMFNTCTGLTGPIPADLFENISGGNSWMFYNAFGRASGLSGYIPSQLFKNCPATGTNPYWDPFGATNLLTSCPANTTSVAAYPGGGNNLSGKAVCSSNCTVGQYYDLSTTSCKACPSGYTSNLGANSQESCYINVADGYYKTGTTNTTTAKCTAGTFRTEHRSYYGYDDQCVPCTSGTYQPSTGQSTCIVCTGRDKYSGIGATSCQTRTYGYRTVACDSDGNSCYNQVACTNAPANAKYVGTPTSADCPWECNTGFTKTDDNKCVQLCSIPNIKYLNTSTGIKIPLYNTKNTTPALVIEYGGEKCYANLQPGEISNGLIIVLDGVKYHAVN